MGCAAPKRMCDHAQPRLTLVPVPRKPQRTGDFAGATAPQLKASFTTYQEATRNKPAAFVQTGSLLGQTLESNATTQNLPEPASLALASLALLGAAAARRRNRG